MNKPLRRYAVPLVAAGLIALTGCSTGDSDSGDDSYSSAASQADMDAAAPEPTSGATPESPGAAEDSADGVNRIAPQTRAVISKGTISLRSEDTEQARIDLQKVLDEHGGTIAEENTSTRDDGTLRNSRLVVRVPVKEFGAAMTDLGQVAELTDSSRNSEDVTTQVIDNEVRIRAQEKSLKRIEILLARAKDIGDIVSIEAQLTSRQADLDSLKAQQAYLEDQTSMSTITVHLEHKEPGAPDEKSDEDRNAFMTGLIGGWAALSALGAGLATFAGAVLPFLVLLAVLGVPLAIGLRRLLAKRRWSPPQMTPEQS